MTTHSFAAFLVVVGLTMCYIAYYLTNATTSTNWEVDRATVHLLPMTIQETLYIGSFIVTFIDLWQYFLSYLIVSDASCHLFIKRICYVMLCCSECSLWNEGWIPIIPGSFNDFSDVTRMACYPLRTTTPSSSIVFQCAVKKHLYILFCDSKNPEPTCTISALSPPPIGSGLRACFTPC